MMQSQNNFSSVKNNQQTLKEQKVKPMIILVTLRRKKTDEGKVDIRCCEGTGTNQKRQ